MKIDIRDLLVDLLTFGGIGLAAYAGFRGLGVVGLAIPGVMFWATAMIGNALAQTSNRPRG